MERVMQKPLIAVLLASVFALNAQAADLIQVYQQALANDATYASARASLTAGQESITQGRAGLLPTIGVTGAYQRSNSSQASWNSGTVIDPRNPSQVIPSYSGTANSRQYTISLQQPLFRWDRWETYEQSKLLQSISEAQFAQAQQDLLTHVAQAYSDVLAAQDTRESTRAQKVATTEQLASAKRNFEVGTQTITDTHEAQAAYDLVVSQEIAAVNDLENKKTALQAIIGTLPPSLATLRPGVTLAPPQPANVDQWVSAAENQNYNVTVGQLSLETAQRQISKNRAGHYPTLDLVASSQHSNVSGQNIASGRTSSNAIGVQYSVPIFSGYAVTSSVRQAIALEDQARTDLEANRRNAALQARQSYL